MRDFVTQFAVGIGLDRIGHRAVVDQRRLLAPAIFDMAVEGVVSGIEQATGEPAVQRLVRVIQDPLPFTLPVQVFCRLCPERLRRLNRAKVNSRAIVCHMLPGLLEWYIEVELTATRARCVSGGASL